MTPAWLTADMTLADLAERGAEDDLASCTLGGLLTLLAPARTASTSPPQLELFAAPNRLEGEE